MNVVANATGDSVSIHIHVTDAHVGGNEDILRLNRGVVLDRRDARANSTVARPFTNRMLKHFTPIDSDAEVYEHQENYENDGQDEGELDQRLPTLA